MYQYSSLILKQKYFSFEEKKKTKRTPNLQNYLFHFFSLFETAIVRNKYILNSCLSHIVGYKYDTLSTSLRSLRWTFFVSVIDKKKWSFHASVRTPGKFNIIILHSKEEGGTELIPLEYLILLISHCKNTKICHGTPFPINKYN